MEICDLRHTNKIVREITSKGYRIHNIEIKPSKSGNNSIGIEATIDAKKKKNKYDIIYEISQIEDVLVVVEST